MYSYEVCIYNSSMTVSSFEAYGPSGKYLGETSSIAQGDYATLRLDEKVKLNEGDKIQIKANVKMGADTTFNGIKYSSSGSVTNLELTGSIFGTGLHHICSTESTAVVQEPPQQPNEKTKGYGRKICFLNDTIYSAKITISVLRKDAGGVLNRFPIYTIKPVEDKTVSVAWVDLSKISIPANVGELIEGDRIVADADIQAAPDCTLEDGEIYYTKSDRVANIRLRYDAGAMHCRLKFSFYVTKVV